MPSAAPTVSAFITIALNGSTIEPVISHSTMKVSATSSATASGRLEAIASCWSMNSAAAPPTSTSGSCADLVDERAGGRALGLAGRQHVDLVGAVVEPARLGTARTPGRAA